jgi:hypothetical protein
LGLGFGVGIWGLGFGGWVFERFKNGRREIEWRETKMGSENSQADIEQEKPRFRLFHLLFNTNRINSRKRKKKKLQFIHLTAEIGFGFFFWMI